MHTAADASDRLRLELLVTDVLTKSYMADDGSAYMYVYMRVCASLARLILMTTRRHTHPSPAHHLGAGFKHAPQLIAQLWQPQARPLLACVVEPDYNSSF